MKHLIPILLALLFASCGSRIHLINPTVEMQGRQIGERDRSGATAIFLATAEPRFSWQYEAEVNNVVQTDYRIIVASSEENVKKGIGDLWDSKR